MAINAIAGIIQNHETLIGYIHSDEYTALKDFDSLWARVKQDENLTKGQQYRNHHATWYGPVDYSYTGVTHSKQAVPADIAKVAWALENWLEKPEGYFNCVLINLYENKGIARHSDDEDIFRYSNGKIGTVATVSLGAEAMVKITPKDKSENWEQTFLAINEGVYAMPSGDFQHRHWHQVSTCKGKRISLTFRHIPSNVLADDAYDSIPLTDDEGNITHPAHVDPYLR